jgi:hypothetical protein
MSKLLSANFSRLWKNKIFRLCTVAIFVFVVFMVLQGVIANNMWDLGRDLDYYYFHLLPYVGLLLSIFISLFLGTDYSDGTIRNKLIIGHTRTEIYLANLLTCFVGCLIFFIVWAVSGFVGIPYLGLWSVGIGGWLQLMLISLLTILATASVLTLISQMITNKAINAVVVIFAALALLLFGSYFYNALCEPETYMDGMVINSDGTVEFGDEIANPAYVSGTLRTVYQVILNILPTGQQIWIADEEVTQPVMMCIYSLAVIIVTTVLGVVLFRKKDLK